MESLGYILMYCTGTLPSKQGLRAASSRSMRESEEDVHPIDVLCKGGPMRVRHVPHCRSSALRRSPTTATCGSCSGTCSSPGFTYLRLRVRLDMLKLRKAGGPETEADPLAMPGSEQISGLCHRTVKLCKSIQCCL